MGRWLLASGLCLLGAGCKGSRRKAQCATENIGKPRQIDFDLPASPGKLKIKTLCALSDFAVNKS
jgi:hypothetical protein